jgi:hypothetical protein
VVGPRPKLEHKAVRSSTVHRIALARVDSFDVGVERIDMGIQRFPTLIVRCHAIATPNAPASAFCKTVE